MRLDGYIRVSEVGTREGESFISPDLQREQIEGWAKSRGSSIDNFHIDLDESGANDDRPGLVEALRRAECGECGGLVVARLDRFARSLTVALDAIKRLDDAGAAFVSVAEGLDPTTPAGKMMMRLMLILAEFESDRIRASWDDAQRKAVERGVHPFSRPPTGYIRSADGHLSPDPAMEEHIAEGFRMRCQGKTWRLIGDYFTDHGVMGPFGNSIWSTGSVEGVIRNRVYLGEARCGRYVNEAAHRPIIDRATWEEAQITRRHQITSRGPNHSL